MGKGHEVEGVKKVDQESKRLHDAAISKGLLSRTRAHPRAGIKPTKVVLNCDGKDIVKRGQRKNKYLFAFPGLVAPVAGGKFGDLSNLDSRNPILYVDFPQGRLKMFGTIVYPKNKYLTLHFSRGPGNITCDDAFESLVVFSEVWWIGRQDENPEELRLPFPYELQQLQEKHSSYSFTAGAGRSLDSEKDTDSKQENFEPISPDLVPIDPQHSSALVKVNATTSAEDMRRTSLRHSTRTAARIIDPDATSDEESSSGSEDSVYGQKTGRNSSRVDEGLKERQMVEGPEQPSASSLPLSLDSGNDEAKDFNPEPVLKTPIISKHDKVAEVAAVLTPVSLTSESEAAVGETTSGRDELNSFDCENQRLRVKTGTDAKKGSGRASKSLKMVASDAALATPSQQIQDSIATGGSSKKRKASASPARSKKKPESHGAVRKRDTKKVSGVILSHESAKKRTPAKKQKALPLKERLDSSNGATSDDEEMSDSSDEDYIG